MKTRKSLLAGVALFAVSYLPTQAVAQSNDNSVAEPDAAMASPGQADVPGQDIIVTGIRGSISRALDAKRNAVGVVDVINAEDIGKLPDQNIAESMSRIPGVQITRREGEGNQFVVRGLDLNRVEINGHAYIGPTQNATPSLQSINPEILSGVEVFKTPSADQIEGSLGALVNLKTRRPLDTNKDFVASGRIQGVYADRVNDFGFRSSGLLSKQFANGTFGVLGAIAYSDEKGRQDGFSTGGWRTTSINPDWYQPNRIVSQIEARHEKRLTANGALQWKPDEDTEVVLEATYSHFKVDRDLNYYQTLLTPTSALGQTATLSNPTVLDDGTVAKATFNNITLRPLPYFAHTNFKSLVIGGSAHKKIGALTIDALGSYSKGNGSDGGSGAPFTFVMVNSPGNVANVTYDLTTSRIHPAYSLNTNFDTLNPQNFQLYSLYDGNNIADNKGYDGQIDLTYDFSDSFLKNIKVGARGERIHLYAENPQTTPTVNAAILARADKNGDGVIRPDELAALRYNFAYSRFLPEVSGDFPHTFLTGQVDPVLGREELGVGQPEEKPASVGDVTETTWAGYATANFDGDLFNLHVRANIGARYVHNVRKSRGFTTGAAAGTYVPVEVDSTFNHLLPSGNIAINLTDNLLLRVAAAKVIARPDLHSVSPGVSVNSVNFSGSAGNPLLKPFEATQQDAAIEWYFAPAGLLSVDLFQKQVDSFTVQTTALEVAPGREDLGPLLISRPENGSSGSIKGFEVNYQQAFRFLPAPFDNLGVQANYTYADSNTPIEDSLNPGKTLPLTNLSKNSYSLIGYYEDGRFQARVAYTYRSRYLESVQTAALGGSIYHDSYGQLDASATFNINDHLRYTLDATGLNKPVSRDYTGTRNRTTTTFINDLRISFGIAATF